MRQQVVAESGQIVVAMIDGEATIKRLIQGPNYYLLKPESSDPAYRSIMIDQEMAILGVVTAVLKQGAQLLDDTQVSN